MSFQPLSDNEFLFTSESVTEGHPDKMADQISDGVLDAVLRDDPYGRVACETLVNTGLVVVSGEISTKTYVDVPKIARDTIRRIGYDNASYGFDCNTCAVITAIDEQSPDIAQGVDKAYESRTDPGDDDELDVAGAGDQGMMFGYATRETAELMPMPISLAHRLAHRLAEVRRGDVMPYLRPDGKTQVTVRYENGRPIEIEKILISTQHKPGVDSDTLIKPDLWEHVVHPILPAELFDEKKLNTKANFLVNPTGKFEIGGPDGRLRPDRPEDHRRHLRRRRPPRRRRVLGQGPVEGGPLRGVRRALRREERRGRRPRRPLRGPGRVRDRRRAPGVADGRDLRDRADRALEDRAAGARALRPPARARSASTSTCTGRSTRRRRPTATSAARTTTSPGRRPTRPTRCATRPGSARARRFPERRRFASTVTATSPSWCSTTRR